MHPQHPTYKSGYQITSRIFIDNPVESLPPRQNTSFQSIFGQNPTSDTYCDLPSESSVDTPINTPPTNQFEISISSTSPPLKKVKISATSSISTHTYPDLSTSKESDHDSGNWDSAGPNEE